MQTRKQQLYLKCQEYLLERIRETERNIADIRDAMANETKSSAGDKYETGREMMQQEMNREQTRLHELKKQQSLIKTIDPVHTHQKVQPGSVVYTDKGNYFIGVSIGKLSIDNQEFQCISLHSPIGKCLKGKSRSDSVQFNGKNMLITGLD